MKIEIKIKNFSYNELGNMGDLFCVTLKDSQLSNAFTIAQSINLYYTVIIKGENIIFISLTPDAVINPLNINHYVQ